MNYITLDTIVDNITKHLEYKNLKVESLSDDRHCAVTDLKGNIAILDIDCYSVGVYNKNGWVNEFNVGYTDAIIHCVFEALSYKN